MTNMKSHFMHFKALQNSSIFRNFHEIKLYKKYEFNDESRSIFFYTSFFVPQGPNFPRSFRITSECCSIFCGRSRGENDDSKMDHPLTMGSCCLLYQQNDDDDSTLGVLLLLSSEHIKISIFLLTSESWKKITHIHHLPGKKSQPINGAFSDMSFFCHSSLFPWNMT